MEELIILNNSGQFSEVDIFAVFQDILGNATVFTINRIPYQKIY